MYTIGFVAFCFMLFQFADPQKVRIFGMEDSEFAIHQLMNNQEGFITQTNIMHQGRKHSRVQLFQFPFEESTIADANLWWIPGLEKLSLDQKSRISQYLDPASQIRFGFTSHGNQEAVFAARTIEREGDLSKISADHKELFEITNITAEMILDVFPWFSLERGDADKLQFQRSTLLLGRYSHPGPPPQSSYLMLKTCGLDIDIEVMLDLPTGLGHLDPAVFRNEYDWALYEFCEGNFTKMTGFKKDTKRGRYDKSQLDAWRIGIKPSLPTHSFEAGQLAQIEKIMRTMGCDF